MSSRMIAEVTADEINLSLQVLTCAKQKLELNQSKYRQLSAEIQRVEQEQQLLDGDKILLNEDLDVAAKAYSRAWCRSFAQKLIKAIPVRELRDSIYVAVLEQGIGTEELYIQPNRTFLASEATSPARYYARVERNNTPHYLSDTYMGTQFTDEICQSLYEGVLLTIADYNDIGRTLTCGPWAMIACRAPYHFIRRIKLILSFEIMGINAFERENTASKADFEHQARCVEHCNMIKRLDGLKLFISIDAMKQGTSAKYEEALVAPVYQLQAQGVKVTVSSNWFIPSINFDYSKPISEWEEKIRTSSVFGTNEIL